MPENGIASAEDFRKAAREGSEPVRLVLPKSGFPVLARRLSPMRVLLTSERFSRLDPQNSSAEVREFAQLMISTIQEILVQPRLALNPGVNEIDPNWLAQEDSDFLFKWGMGVIDDQGVDLAQEFREKRDSLPAPSANGGGLRDAAIELGRDSKPDGGAAV